MEGRPQHSKPGPPAPHCFRVYSVSKPSTIPSASRIAAFSFGRRLPYEFPSTTLAAEIVRPMGGSHIAALAPPRGLGGWEGMHYYKEGSLDTVKRLKGSRTIGVGDRRKEVLSDRTLFWRSLHLALHAFLSPLYEASGSAEPDRLAEPLGCVFCIFGTRHGCDGPRLYIAAPAVDSFGVVVWIEDADRRGGGWEGGGRLGADTAHWGDPRLLASPEVNGVEAAVGVGGSGGGLR